MLESEKERYTSASAHSVSKCRDALDRILFGKAVPDRLIARQCGKGLKEVDEYRREIDKGLTLIVAANPAARPFPV